MSFSTVRSLRAAATVGAATLAVALAPYGVTAAPILGQGNPRDAIPGGTVVDFEATPIGTYAILSFPGMTITGTDNIFGAQMRVSDTYAGQYNNRGDRYLDDGAGFGYQTLIFTFDAPVSEFAFLFGASDVDWTLTARDAANNPIESLVIAPLRASNAGDYFGIQVSGIASATLTSSALAFRDDIFVDNVTFRTAAVPGPSGSGVVPEPGTLALATIGLLPLAGAIVCKRRKA